MSNQERFRSRKWYTAKAPAHSWVHAGWYSRGNPDRTVYFLCTPHGPLTINEEYFCWVFAVTGKYRMSRRMAYGRNDTNPINSKLRGRVADLLLEHEEGKIDLSIGPWKHYGYDIGNPTMFHNTNVRDFMPACLKR